MLRLLTVTAFVFSIAMQTSLADASEAMEYVLNGDGTTTLRSEAAEPFGEKIEPRQDALGVNRWITQIKQASVTLFVPEGEPTAAVVICPGGGYMGHSFDNEGTRFAEWFAARGMAAGVVKYRTFTGQPLGDKPLKDAQSAVLFMKKKFGVPVGVAGFSAGGHLTAMVANYPPEPASDGKPWLAFHAMMYPVISMQSGVTHGGSRKLTLGDAPTEDDLRRFSADQHVTSATSPAFLLHTADDPAVPVKNSLLYYAACQAADVPVEMHLYPTGGHGYGMRPHKGTLNNWTAAFEAWLRSNKMITD